MHPKLALPSTENLQDLTQNLAAKDLWRSIARNFSVYF